MSLTVQVPGFVTAIVDEDGAVLLDLRQGKYFSVNEVGAVIWQGLAAGHEPAEIARRLSEQFDADAAMCVKDVDEFIERLFHERLVDGAE